MEHVICYCIKYKMQRLKDELKKYGVDEGYMNDGQPQTYTAVLIFLKEAGLINKL